MMGMRNMSKTMKLVLPCLLLSWAGCSGSSKCAPGKTTACACPGGKTGVQTCLDDSTFGACQCDETGDDGGVVAVADQGTGETGGPQFLSFGTDSTKLTEGESITFTAVLTDPDGIDDLIGGSLKSQDGQHDFGSFATSAQEGAYSFELTWKQLGNAVDLTFKGAQSFTFVAVFFDSGGNKASRSATIKAYCDLGGACDGTCVDLMNDASNCGACGNTCTLSCREGRCEQWSSCHPTPASCKTICSAEGKVCDDKYLKLHAYTQSVCSGYKQYSYNFNPPPACSTTYSPTVELPIPNQSGWYPLGIECLCLQDPP